jgi:uncharacterized SAM-binding protein YcdF (DUF218 family)
MKSWWNDVITVLITVFYAWLSAVSTAGLAIAITAGLVGVPRSLIVWLAGGQIAAYPRPDVIVVLGGGGMPSESGLIRSYYAAEYARKWPAARVIVALPGRLGANNGSVQKMRDELVLRGVPPATIQIECTGRNTYEQARQIYQLIGGAGNTQTLAIISSLIHLRRAIGSFQKQGFENVFGLPAASAPLDTSMGKRQFVRYRFWQNLGWTISVIRELLALALYKWRGWI